MPQCTNCPSAEYNLLDLLKTFVMKVKFTLIIILLTLTASSQSIKYLEKELSYYKSGETYGDKIKLAKLLQKKDPFNEKAIEYICRYYSDRKIDSVTIFFKNLVDSYPRKAEPYLLQNRFAAYIKDVDSYGTDERNSLLKALHIKPGDDRAIFELGKLYYNDFILNTPESDSVWKMEVREIIRTLDTTEADWIVAGFKEQLLFNPSPDYTDSDKNALHYFEMLWHTSPKYRELLFYPIKQLQCHRKILTSYHLPATQDNFFPALQFINSGNWDTCNLATNYLYEAECALSSATYVTEQLSGLKERPLHSAKSEIYRVTYLPSFHHPIAIRMEKEGEAYMLYWKVGKGAGGYKPKGIKQQGKLKLTKVEWEKFESLLAIAKYDTLPKEENVPMTDGASWIVERKKQERYDAKKTDSPGAELYQAWKYLVQLAGIGLEER